MLTSLLIANRGEIARRVIRTCRRLGVATVAVFSDADAETPFVREADRAVGIGASYMAGDAIIRAALDTGSAAIHPGYGFLSENADFAQAVIAAGIIWIGPPPTAIRAMGLKDAAKTLMARAGVATTPGYLGKDQSDARLQAAADRIGYPVLIKAVAGGGGKGMRRVDLASDFATALAACRREAAAGFGDDRVLLETYVTRPRHIEVQVFADKHGHAVHLFERDCSLQRRHQKVIEEAPAPGLDPPIRAAICDAAVKAARAVGYEGAGTIEFIADASEGLRPDRIWFMEMNTRLQVEHPVTEAITGQDLVEWQLRVASGEPLPLAQDQLRIGGHAIEARLYAENPGTGFLPSTGPLTHFRLPGGDIRIDSAVEQGSEIMPLYDPMIAKLIAHGPTREAAAARLAAACREIEIWPVKTNAAFLARALAHPDFRTGQVDTGFIVDRLGSLLPPAAAPVTACEAAALARLARAAIPAPLTGFRLNAAPRIDVALEQAGTLQAIALPHPLPRASLSVATYGDETIVFDAGEAYAFRDPTAATGQTGAGTSDGAIRSPMPGRILTISAAVGDQARKGAPLLVLEAMKMEYVLTAPFDGTVAALNARVGEQVTEGVPLIRLEPPFQ